jgi:predicted ribosome quality control (RQC) complex YloA/Tae2 family protein
MEKAIQLSNLALKHLVDENQLIVNGFINKLQTLENSWMKIKVHTKQGDKTFVVTPNSFFISAKPLNAKQNPGGFSAFLRKHLFNQRIISLKQHGLDRIVILEFPEKYLLLEMFAKGNVILCDKEMNILLAMHKEKWKDRTLQKDQVYKFPSSRGKSPLEIDEKEFLEKLLESEKTLFGACIEILNVSPAIMEHIFTALKLDKTKDSNKSKSEGKKVLKNLIKVYSAKATKVYLSKGNIYTTKTDELAEKSFKNLNEALNELLIGEIKPFVLEENKVKKTKDRTGEYLSQIKENELKEIEYKEVGEKIYLEYDTISKIIEAVKKGKAKGVSAKEIKEKINSVNPIIRKIDFDKNKLVVEL